MNNPHERLRMWTVGGAALVFFPLAHGSAAAQRGTHPSEVRLLAGVHGLGNQDPAIGGGVAWAIRLTPRIRIEPEAQALWWENCIDEGPPIGIDCRGGPVALLGASLVVDLGDPTARTVVYSIGGGGALRGGPTTDDPFFYLQGGLGLRVWLSRRFFLAPEARLAFPHVFQLTASAGFPVR